MRITCSSEKYKISILIVSLEMMETSGFHTSHMFLQRYQKVVFLIVSSGNDEDQVVSYTSAGTFFDFWPAGHTFCTYPFLLFCFYIFTFLSAAPSLTLCFPYIGSELHALFLHSGWAPEYFLTFFIFHFFYFFKCQH